MKTGNRDLRVMSLLHSLGDKEELIREAVRLLMAPDMDETVWCQVHALGIDIAPDHPLFDSGKTFSQIRAEFVDYPQHGSRRIIVDRRKGERRSVQRRAEPDRRRDERRSTALPWLGEERRDDERRKSRRRRADLLDIQPS